MDGIERYKNIWLYYQFCIVPIGFLLAAICLIYYCRLRQYVKGESMVAMSIVLDTFRTKMVIEYEKACKVLIGMVAFFIMWMVGIVLLSINKHLTSIPYLILVFIGNLIHRIGFCYYLWIRYDPLKDDEFHSRSMDRHKDKYQFIPNDDDIGVYM
eukprot:441423_1